MVNINLILLISTIICLVCCCTFTILSTWTYFKGKDNENNVESESEADLLDDDLEGDEKAKNNKATSVKEKGDDLDDDHHEDKSNGDDEKKGNRLKWYITFTILSFLSTIGLGIGYWYTRNRDKGYNAIQPPQPPSPEEVARDEARKAMLKMSKNYDTLESEITSESNDGLDAVNLIAKYNAKTAR